MRIGTRGSELALRQAADVASRLRAAHSTLDVEVVTVVTRGDADRDTPLREGVGWFTTAIQDALIAGECDVAVHSYKDLPTARPDGLSIAAVPVRADPRDALVSRGGHTLHRLPEGAVLGTSSPRREAQVRAIRPDIEIRPIRGNVDTRIAKVRDGDYDATVLAYAGLERLGRTEDASHVFGYEEMLPAPAQGVLAVECRSADTGTRDLLAAIHDRELGFVVTAERTFLATLEAGCHFPAAAYAEVFGTTLKLHALVAAEDGRIVRSKLGGPLETAGGLGKALAEELLAASRA